MIVLNELFKGMIRDICKGKGVSVNELSFGYILQLKKENKIKYLFNHSFPLNSQVAGKLADDKYAAYEIFKNSNIPVIEHNIIFNREYNSDIEYWNYIKTYFEANNKKIVIKPNNGHNGIGVFVCDNFDDIKNVIHENFKNAYDFLLCPYYESIAEYRTIYLDGACLLTYRKIKPFVIGNGIDSIRDLFFKNKSLGKNKLSEITSSIDLESAPKKDEKIELSWKYNLSSGAIAEIIPDGELKSKIETISILAAKAIAMKFASVDIIHTPDNKLLVMEVNSNVYMDKFLKHDSSRYPIVKEIYEKAIDSMFE